MLTCGGGGGRSSAVMGKRVEAAVEAVEAVRVVRVVRIRLCTLSKCEAIAVDMTSPSDWSKWVRGSMDCWTCLLLVATPF